ncbi:AI-2E family transporter [Thalassospira alkalitolerans]|uniref:Membrane protein n=1 Tax=Thalassospira alkalitolerans TaxID=1293890 RepID=A0A1Y2LBI1_9PROT|nr:AI-2E family transporter [Thalassospira alkalitolerans]OSQ48048.1 membrane protein [Thalassospira alkalitolerans]|tara:strand:- start:3507 stop:4616 length:1110 start_codon:yes stop_codon:yes gene_type:complete
MTFRQQARFWLIFVVGFFFLVWLFSGILLPFVAGMAIAYFLDPLADRLEERGFNRTVATTIITFLFFLVFIFVLLLVVPMIGSQLAGFLERLPGYVDALRITVGPYVQHIVDRIAPETLAGISDSVKGQTATAIKWVGNILTNVLSGGLALLNFISLLFITPVVSFYLLRDWDKIVAKIDGYLPRRSAKDIRQCASEIDETLAGFVRGQATVCLLLGLFYAIGLTFVGLEFGFVIGLMTGLVSFVPYFGMIAGFAIGMGVALAQFGPSVDLALVAMVFGIGQLLEGNFLTPKLVGDKVGLHAVWVMFALLAGGAVFGLLGVMLAVPVAAVIGVLVRYGLRQYLSSRLYDHGSDQARHTSLQEPTEDAKS